MSNITIDDVTIEGVCGSAILKGTEGALVQNVEAKNLRLQVVAPLPAFAKRGAKPWLISCGGEVRNATVSFGLDASWASPVDKAQWSGVERQPGCAKLKSGDGMTSGTVQSQHP